MKILIVGSKGFIGSHCMTYFKSRNHDVMGCDIHDSAEPNYISMKSISNDFNYLFKNNTFDLCINAAGSAYVNFSFEYPEKDFELNVSLVINLLGAIKNNLPKCKFINFSSAAIYGNPIKLPIQEDANTYPLSPYGYHKLLSEKVLYEYNRFFGLENCSLRVFSAYGEGLKKQLFWDIYNNSLLKDEIKLYGTGMESRDFIYILDLMQIVELIIQKGDFKGECYNIGNGEEVYIKDAAKLLLDELEWKGTIIFSGDSKVGDPLNWKADIQKILDLGYKRKYGFLEGIKNYSSWLKSHT